VVNRAPVCRPGTVEAVSTLDDLDAAQRQAAAAPHAPLAIIAGPGSGKTRTAVARIAHLVERGDTTAAKVLALTHTTKAAGELKDRLRRVGCGAVTATTVHAAAWRLVRTHGAVAGIDEPKLVSSTWGMLREALAQTGKRSADADVVSELSAELEWARANLLDANRYARAAKQAGRATSLDAATIASAWEAYASVKRREGVLDFADVLETAVLLMGDDGVARQVQAQYGSFFVDEYQDIDRAQQQVIEAWLGDRRTLTVAGDPEQAIFGFKGGDPSLLLGFEQRWPDATVVHLTRNYRSTPQVVQWVNALTLVKRPPLVGAGVGPKPQVVAAANEADEERRLVDRLHRWHREGVAWEEMAVLYRYNATAARLEAALTSGGVPHHVAGGARFFDRPEVRAVLVPFGARARSERGADGIATLVAAATSTGWDEAAPPQGLGAARQRWEAVAALVSLAREHYAGVDAGTLLGELQQRARDAHDLTPGGVTLATAHAAKGLEWDAVWVAGATEGQFPSAYAKTPAQLGEEQHLLYVAVSRSRRELVVSWSQRRQNNWRAEPSRFLPLLEGRTGALAGKPAGAARNRAARPGTRGQHSGGSRDVSSRDVSSRDVSARDVEVAGLSCEACGGRLSSLAARVAKRCSGACLSGDAAARHDRLVVWRAEQAAALGIAAKEIATDRALFTIAVTERTAGVVGLSLLAGTPPL
jgi:DNA helicase-2/ATP-dependent DNA helicase PcrA